MKFSSLKFTPLFAFSVAVLLVVGALYAKPSAVVHSDSPNNRVGGWAWSSNIGWICFYDATGCPNASVTLDASNNLVGYAWSSTIGWIQFGNLSGFPNASTQVVTFTTSQPWTVPGSVTSVATLVVAGGGGGGNFGGGGGGGGVIYNSSYAVTPGSVMNVTVGRGGYGDYDPYGTGDNGENSVFGTLTAIGGGGGGSMQFNNNAGTAGANGGSGGGGSATWDTSYNTAGGTGVSGQGYNGGMAGGDQIPPWCAGGGGGAGAVGGAGSAGGGGGGGSGVANSITGSSVYYAGGGGGASLFVGLPGSGGRGGGGDGGTQSPSISATSGDANTGGGGGGATLGGVGGDGGSGVVIVRYTPSVSYPSAVNAKMQSDRKLVGWAKAVIADGNGWDGWISLAATGHGDGITVDSSGNFQGYVWGGEVVGWINFCQSQGCVSLAPPCATTAGNVCSNSTTVQTTDVWCAVTTTACTSSQVCSNGSCISSKPQGTLTVTPLRIRKNATVQISWTAINATSCSVTGSYLGGTLGPYTNSPSTSAPVPAPTTFTLSCRGSDNVMYAVDKKTVSIVPTYQEI